LSIIAGSLKKKFAVLGGEERRPSKTALGGRKKKEQRNSEEEEERTLPGLTGGEISVSRGDSCRGRELMASRKGNESNDTDPCLST